MSDTNNSNVNYREPVITPANAAILINEEERDFSKNPERQELSKLEGVLMLQDQYRTIMENNIPKNLSSGSEKPRTRRASRWDRITSEDRKMRDRERSYDERDSDSERSPNGGIIDASDSEIDRYKSQPPNNTIMIRGLAPHISEFDIRHEIIQCGLRPKDIRLAHKKQTGASRGYAFVEFSTIREATRWMNIKQGVLMLQDQYRGIMQYSIPKDISSGSEKPITHKASADWFCKKCGAQNFKRRDTCFKCDKDGGSGSDGVCYYPTKTIMMRNLDALTTEDSVMAVLNTVIPELMKTISAVCIRDLTSMTRRIFYLGTESIVDVIAIYDALRNLQSPLNIDGKEVKLSYCKYNMGDPEKEYCRQEDKAAFPNAAVPSTYSIADVDALAEYAASIYAKSSDEYVQYLEYYKFFFTQQINDGKSITLHQENQMDAANAAAVAHQSANQQMAICYANTHHIPTGTDGKIYSVPDVSKYVFDNSSGYYFDSTTGLYYDQYSRYYWNSVIQKYLYWDQEKHSYILAPTYDNYSGPQQMMAAYSNTNDLSGPSQQMPAYSKTNPENEGQKHNPEKQDKMKQNEKLESEARKEKKITYRMGALTYRMLECMHGVCFDDVMLYRALRIINKLSNNIHLFLKSFCEDRAKERRMKYGDSDEPQPNKLKEKYLKSRELLESLPVGGASITEPIGSQNVGNKILRKMGWSEGQGLGKLNQGRTTIIQSNNTPVQLAWVMRHNIPILRHDYDYYDEPSSKKRMYARYQELTEKENSVS